MNFPESSLLRPGLGVDVYLGEARFTGPDTLQGGDRHLGFGRAVIATGARAGSSGSAMGLRLGGASDRLNYMSTGSAIIVSVALLLFCVYSAFRKLVVALVVLAVAAFCFGYDDLIGVVSGVTARANVAGVTKQGTLYSITSCAPLSLRINDKTITFQSFPHEETIDYLAAHPESVSAGGSYEVTPKELRWQAARR